MSSELAKDLIRRYGELRDDFQRFEPEFRAVAHYLAPQRSPISPTEVDGDWQRFQGHMYNSLPVVFKDQLAAHLYSLMINPAGQWVGLTVADPDLRAWHPVKTWLGNASQWIQSSFAPSVSTFYANAMPLLSSSVAFGDTVQFDRFDEGRQMIIDQTLPLGQALFHRNLFGEIDVMMWRFQRTGPEAVAEWPDGSLPAKVKEKADKKDGKSKFWFILAIYEADGWEPGKMGADGKPWRSAIVAEDDKHIVRQSGFFESPVASAPWLYEPGQAYGRGQGYASMASIKLVNNMEEALIRQAQFAAKPVNLVGSEKILPRGRELRPGTNLYGAVKAGKRYFDQVGASGTIGITAEQQTNTMNVVREAFHGTLFHLQGRTGLTPDEWFDQHANGLRQIAPMLGNVESHYLQQKIARRYAFGVRIGAIDPPPKELEEVPLDIEMRSAAAMALRAGDGQATVQLLRDAGAMAQLGDRAAARLAARLDVDGTLEVLQEARGAPAKVLRSRDDADADEARAQQLREVERMAELAPGVAGAARDLAEVQQ